MTIWANRKARQDLKEFLNLIVQYFKNIARNSFADEIEENMTASKVRQKINLMSNRVTEWATASGHDSGIIYCEAPRLGGRTYPINLISNVFNFAELEIEPRMLTDVLEKALGVYQDDATRALVRTCSPFFWIGRLFDVIASLPFVLLGRLGFNQNDAETSIIGKLIKTLLYLIQVAAAYLAIADKLGFLERTKKLIGF